MSALLYLYSRTFKNRLLAAVQSPNKLAKFLILGIAFVLFAFGAMLGYTGVAPMRVPLLMIAAVFLFPFFVGRYGGLGTYYPEDVSHIFAAPIKPRTVMLSMLVRQFGGILTVCLCVLFLAFFVSSAYASIAPAEVLWVAVFCVVLTVVCRLLGMAMSVSRKTARLIRIIFLSMIFMMLAQFALETTLIPLAHVEGLSGWRQYLINAYLTSTYNPLSRAEGFTWWQRFFDLVFIGTYDLPRIAVLPLVGWAAGAAYAFANGFFMYGWWYTLLLLITGYFLFKIIYRSSPDFYEEAQGIINITAKGRDKTKKSRKVINVLEDEPKLKGDGAAVFMYKHLREAKRQSLTGIISSEFIGMLVFAVLWGVYARFFQGQFAVAASLFSLIGVPVETIFAILVPLVFIAAVCFQFDYGNTELFSQYLYLLPDKPLRKWAWVNMTRIITVLIITVVVIGIAGVVSGTSVTTVAVAMLAYLSCCFMVLGLRLALVRFLGVAGARQGLVSTLPVLFICAVGVVGMLLIFYFGPEGSGMVLGMLSFAGWCMLVGGVCLTTSWDVLHDVDAPV